MVRPVPGVVSKHFFQGGTLILIERAFFTASVFILVEITAQIWFCLESEHVLLEFLMLLIGSPPPPPPPKIGISL